MRRIDILIFVVLLANISCKKGDTRITCYKDGTIKTVTEMKGGLMHGKHEYYYPSGKLESRGYYFEGKENGILEHFFENGKLRSRASWLTGKEDGLAEIFFENSQLLFSAVYERGSIIGESFVFYETGKLREKKLYDTLGNIIHIMNYAADGSLQKSFVVPYVDAEKDTVMTGEQLEVNISFGLPLTGEIQIKASETDDLGISLHDDDIVRCTGTDTVSYKTAFGLPGYYELSFHFKHSNSEPNDTLTVQNVVRNFRIVVIDSIVTNPSVLKGS
jgi:hypothetical protein